MQTINIGTLAGDGTGDTIKAAFSKAETNFNTLYTAGIWVSRFGDGSDGALSTTGNVTHASTANGPVVIKQYSSLTINSGHTMTVSNPCKGLAIYVQGDCTINGTLSMSLKGANVGGAPYSVRFQIIRPLYSSTLVPEPSGFPSFFEIPQTGGAGGVGSSLGAVAGTAGTAGVNGGTGGGGSSGTGLYGYAGDGAAGSAFGGGGGGGGWYNSSGGGIDSRCYAVGAGGGNGGTSSNTTASSGSGAGNPAGYIFNAGPGSNVGGVGTTGVGGIIILVVGGNLTIGSSGLISADGGSGGTGNQITGGGSGGGAIWTFLKGVYTNSGTVRANGGAGGTGGGSAALGGAGGNGSTMLVYTG